jgi:hypothetical protein
MIGPDAAAELFTPVDISEFFGSQLVLDLGRLLIGLALTSCDQ